MLKFSADVQTTSASKYLQQLCKHFAHKVTVDYTPEEARVQFPPGRCLMLADTETLRFHCQADNEKAMPVIKDIIERHLVKFVWREELTFQWVNEIPAEAEEILLSPAFMTAPESNDQKEGAGEQAH